MKIRINEDLRAIIPPLSADERAGLEADIVADGVVREPLVLWDGVIVDGHNRYDIATKHSIPFTTVDKEFEDLRAVRVWMRNNQLHRRNISDGWKLKLVRQNKEEMLVKGREKYKETVGRPDKSVSNNDSNLPEHSTQKEMAKELNWSTGKVAQGEYAMDNAPPEVWQKAMDGEISIHKAYKAAKANAVGEVDNEPKCEGKEKKERITIQPVSDARYYVDLAISQLARIRDDDPSARTELERITEWIERRSNEL